jgi:geranylgeranyl reductase family protein
MKPVEDVAVIGAGPAGAYCAFKLARQGLKPVVFDHSHPREKPCGGGISPPVLKRFPFVEKFRSGGFTFGNFRFISCIGTEVMTKGLENGFSVSRRYFDQGILNMALQNGAKLVKEKVLDVQKKGNVWNVETEKTEFSSKVIVGADGVRSMVRRKTVGPISKENLALTFGYLASRLAVDDATIKFLAEIPGYIWVFPGKGYSNIGIGSELRYGCMLKGLLDSFISFRFPRIRIISKYAAMLPSASEPEFFSLPCAGKDWVLIGDAAGHADPIWGGGILYALWGGKLAAQAIKNNDVESFDDMWRADYGKILVERCKNKEAFHDPLKSTVSMIIGLADQTYFWPTL